MQNGFLPQDISGLRVAWDDKNTLDVKESGYFETKIQWCFWPYLRFLVASLSQSDLDKRIHMAKNGLTLSERSSSLLVTQCSSLQLSLSNGPIC